MGSASSAPFAKVVVQLTTDAPAQRRATMGLGLAGALAVAMTVIWGASASRRAATARVCETRVVAEAVAGNVGRTRAGRGPLALAPPTHSAAGIAEDGDPAQVLAALLRDDEPLHLPGSMLCDLVRAHPEWRPVLREGLDSPNPRVRANAAEGLAVFVEAGADRPADPNAVRAVFEPLLSDPALEVRTHAALALIREMPEAARQILLQAAEPGAPVCTRAKVFAIYALGALGAREATPVLCRSLQHGRANLPRAAADVLGNLRARAAVPNLEAALADEDPWLVTAAIGALGDIGDPAALPAVRRAARLNPSPLGQTVAQRAIERLSVAARAQEEA